MDAKTLEQLWYTWSDIGVDDVGPGFRIRAASPGWASLQRPLYPLIRTYADHQLPDGVDSNGVDLPIDLALFNTPYGKFLLHDISLPRDHLGRSGNFFAHFVFGLPEHFSARDAIRLWGSPFWRVCDVPEYNQSPLLNRLSLNAMQQKEQCFNFVEIQNHLRSLILAFLAPSRLQQRVAIIGTSYQIVALIWGLTHSIPKTLLSSDFTFTTYKYHTDRSHETIVGTTTIHELDSDNYSEPTVKYMPEPQPHPTTSFAAEVANFVEFAVQCLVQTSNGRSSQLENFVKQGEKANITSVKEFIILFKEFLVQEKLPPLADALAHALMSNDPLAVLRLCNELTKLFPPIGNERAWYDLFQSLSEASLRERIIEHKETHQWLLGSLATALPGSTEHLSFWLSGSWKDLAQFLALDLPERWHKEAIAVTLLASRWTQMNLTADLIIMYQRFFTEVLQQFVIEPDEKYSEAVLDFFKVWEPNNPAQKRQLCITLINTDDAISETQRQLTAIVRSDQSSLLSQVSPQIIAQSTSAGGKNLLIDLLTYASRLLSHIFQRGKRRHPNHTKR